MTSTIGMDIVLNLLPLICCGIAVFINKPDLIYFLVFSSMIWMIIDLSYFGQTDRIANIKFDNSMRIALNLTVCFALLALLKKDSFKILIMLFISIYKLIMVGVLSTIDSNHSAFVNFE